MNRTEMAVKFFNRPNSLSAGTQHNSWLWIFTREYVFLNFSCLWGTDIQHLPSPSTLFLWVSSVPSVEASLVFHLQSSQFTQPWAVPLTTAKLFPDSPRYNFLPWHLIYIWSLSTAMAVIAIWLIFQASPHAPHLAGPFHCCSVAKCMYQINVSLMK